MDFFEAVEKRRSIRQFTKEKFTDDFVKKALDAALLAPNSSNVQTWDFFWIKSEDKKAKVVEACMSQAAARTASQLVVVTADPRQWKRSVPSLISFVERVNAPKVVHLYYRKLIPLTYRTGFLNCLAPLKWIASTAIGFVKPISRGPYTLRDLQGIAVKSAALASENLMLAITAQGGATCPMEGFDEWRLRKILPIRCSAEIVMVIGIGYAAERGTWGEQYRLPTSEVVHEL